MGLPALGGECGRALEECPRALIGSALRLAPGGLDGVFTASTWVVTVRVEHGAFSGSASACEAEQPLQVVGHGDQVPLAADLVETS